MFNDLRVFFALVVISLIGLAGLFMAAKAELSSSQTLGLGVFFAAVAVGVLLIRRALDRADA